MGITPVGQAEWMSERIVSRHLKPLTYHGRPPRADGPAVEESCSPRHRALRTGETPVIQQGSSRLESRSGTHCGFGTWRTALRLPFALRPVQLLGAVARGVVTASGSQSAFCEFFCQIGFVLVVRLALLLGACRGCLGGWIPIAIFQLSIR